MQIDIKALDQKCSDDTRQNDTRNWESNYEPDINDLLDKFVTEDEVEEDFLCKESNGCLDNHIEITIDDVFCKISEDGRSTVISCFISLDSGVCRDFYCRYDTKMHFFFIFSKGFLAVRHQGKRYSNITIPEFDQPNLHLGFVPITMYGVG